MDRLTKRTYGLFATLAAVVIGLFLMPGASLAEIALAWVVAQPGVAAPIASATSIAQLDLLVRGVRLTLSPDDLAALTAAGA